MRLTRRSLGTVAAGAVAGGLAPSIVRAQPSVKIGTAVLGSYILAGPVVAAVEKGFFREAGLSAEFVPFRGGPDLAKAVIAGEVLVGLTGSTDIIVFREAGMPIRMTATQGEGNDFVLVGRPEGAKMADLKGKAIGVTRAGAAAVIGAKLNWTADVVAAVHKAWTPYFPEDGRISIENLKAMQEALLDAGSVRKRLPLDEHYTTEFTPVRL